MRNFDPWQSLNLPPLYPITGLCCKSSDISVNTKRCSKCKENKPLSEFYSHQKTRDGLQSNCKACMNECARAYYHRHADRLRHYRLEHPVYAEKTREQARARYWQDPERGREQSRHYHYTHLEECRARWRRTYHANREKAIEKANRSQITRKARIKANGGSYMPAEWEALLASYGGLCLACGTTEKVRPDHVIPLSKGGGSDISNLQPLCGRCNLLKGTKIIDYRQ